MTAFSLPSPMSLLKLPTLISRTAPWTKTSPQNITLHYRKFFAIISFRSRPTMWAKYPKNKLVTSGFRVKWRMKGLYLYAQVVVKTSNFVISSRCCAEYSKHMC